MKYKSVFGLIVLSLFVGSCAVFQPKAKKEPRSLYVYSFGGIEDMKVDDAVEMISRLGYAGIAAQARSEQDLDRLSEYQQWSQRKGDDFIVEAAFMAHRFDKYGFSDADHRAAIDRMAGKGGYIWVWVRDVVQDGSITEEKIETFIRGILDYAISKDVKVVLYPHYNTYFPTTEDALDLVEKINHPSFGVAINLCHELMSDKGEVAVLKKTFEIAKDRISAIIISGSMVELDRTSVRTMNESTIKSLDESVYDLRPYLRLIKTSGYDGPIGFINFKQPASPEDYLQRTIKRWRELCQEVGLYENKKTKSN
ncbi:MAG: TIM barrel protein [Bacteroidetes bacterium]|nr:TIM barrel protein [Bacteroidota bacterium]